MSAAYVAIPLDACTLAWVEASTAGTLDAARVTHDGRVVLCFRAEVPEDLAKRRYASGGAEYMTAWLARREPADVERGAQAVEANRVALVARLVPEPGPSPELPARGQAASEGAGPVLDEERKP